MVRWQRRDGTVLVPGDKYQLRSVSVGRYKSALSAVVLALEPSDYTEYVCVAENQYGTDNDSMVVYGR